jgi:hypothetical protein
MDDRRFPIHYRYRGPISDLVYEVVDYYVYLGEDGEPTGKVDHVVQAAHGVRSRAGIRQISERHGQSTCGFRHGQRRCARQRRDQR